MPPAPLPIDVAVHGHLRSLYEHNMDGVLLARPDGRVLMANPAACEILGLSEAGIIDRGREGLFDWTEPATQEAMRAYETTRQYRGVVTALHGAGTRVPVELSAREFTGDDGEAYTSVVLRDLRGQRALEQARYLSEQRFGKLVEISQVVWNASADLKRVHAPGWERFTGLPLAAAQDGVWLEAVHPEDRERAAEAWRSAARRAVPFCAEFRLPRAGGGYGRVRSRAVAVRDEQGQPIEWLGVIEDIEAQRQASEALAERERTFRGIFEVTAQGIIVQDQDGRFVEVNAAATEILGRTQADLIGRTPRDEEWRVIRADGSHWPVEERPSVVALRTGSPVGHQLMGIWNPVDGAHRWLLVHARPVFREGEDRPFRVCVGFVDVTAMRDATQAAMVAAERTRVVLETVAEAITIVDADGVITFANPAAERVLGLAASEIPGRTYGDPRWRITAVDGGVFPLEELPFSRVRDTGMPVYDVQHAITLEDGRRIVLSVDAAPLHGPDGEFAGMVSAVRDVTQQQRERARLAHLAAVLASSPDAMISTTPAGLVTSWNAAAEEIFGYTAEEMLGRPAARLVPADAREEFELIRSQLASGDGRSAIDTWRLRKDGTRLPVSVSVSPIRAPDGAVVEYAAILRDITARRQADEQLRFQASLLDNVQEAVAAVGADGTYVYLNHRAHELLGWQAEQVLGKHFRDVVPRGFPPQVVDLVERSMRGETWTGEVSARGPNGNSVPGLLTLAPIQASDGTVTGVVGLFADLRVVRSLEEQLEHAQKMEAIGRLAGGVAHDFNNVLTAIQGHAQLALEEASQAGRTREDLEEILRSSERATTLTRHLLAFSRRQVLQPRVVEVSDVVQGMDRMLRRLIDEDVEFINDCPAHVARVLVDPVQLEQVVLNLVMNARDAMPSGGRIIMRTRAGTPGSDPARADTDRTATHVLISVSDNGSGIPSEIQQRIFEPFFTTKAPGKGSGLGLSTAYGIVKQSGGFISVSSREGEGSTFTVHLPRVDAAEQSEPGRAIVAAGQTGTGTVLLVEDEPAVRRLAHRILAGRGYTVLEAQDGVAALEVASRFRGTIDVLVTDIVMPRLNGLELVTHLREQRPDIAVLLVSGYSEEVVERRGRIPEHCVFLGKPFTPAALASAVRDAVAAHGAVSD